MLATWTWPVSLLELQWNGTEKACLVDHSNAPCCEKEYHKKIYSVRKQVLDSHTRDIILKKWEIYGQFRSVLGMPGRQLLIISSFALYISWKIPVATASAKVPLPTDFGNAFSIAVWSGSWFFEKNVLLLFCLSLTHMMFYLTFYQVIMRFYCHR